MTKSQYITKLIADAMASGYSIDKAIDRVLGEGTYEKLVSDLYDELRK